MAKSFDDKVDTYVAARDYVHNIDPRPDTQEVLRMARLECARAKSVLIKAAKALTTPG